MRQISPRQYRFVCGVIIVGAVAVIGGLGCASNQAPSSDSAASPSSAPAAADAAGVAVSKEKSSSGAAKAKDPAPAAIPRKIIYNAEVELVADNLSTAQQALLHIVTVHKGYVAETKIGGEAGSKREGTWKIRVPVDEYNAALAEISKLGALQSIHSDSQDVSAEYFDLEAHISNKQVEEQRLLMHLQKSTARLQDILLVEREISRVRGEIEEMQGRLRVLANQTALSTITVTINETREYVAPRPTSFREKIAQTFMESVHGLRDLLEFAILIVVGSLPWLLAGAVAVAIVWPIARRVLGRPANRRDDSADQRPPPPPNDAPRPPGDPGP